jgi:uncharacterized OB-fold protein
MARAAKPLPKPTPDTQPFWDALKQHRLMLPKCKACGKLHFFPRPFCPHCFSWDLEWVRCSGKGKLYSFLINHRPAPGFEEETPYVIAVVELDEGPRMLSNLIDIEPTPEAVQVDMPVEVLFQDINEETTMFKFRPA